MKKLAFVINVFRENDFHSGGEKLFFELVNRSINDGNLVDLYCTTYLGEKDGLKKQLNKIIFLGKPKDFKYPEKIEAFYKKIEISVKKENYDFVISENISPPIDIGVLQGHSLLHYKKNAGNFLLKILFEINKGSHIKAQKKWLKQPYRKIIAPSVILKKELIDNFSIPEEKFIIIHPGVERPVYNSKCAKTDKPFTFGLSAPSFGKKGGYIFLKAIKELKRNGYDFKARIIYPKFNKNPLLKLLVKYYGLEKCAEFMPYQQDMENFYNSVDCIVMPSFMETFGLVALESMIRSKPAVTGSFCGASEIISDGENGFIFDMNGKSHKNLALKLEAVLNNQSNYQKISENAYKTALKYNWDNFYNQFNDYILSSR